MSGPSFRVPTVQAHLDAHLGSTILQALFLGLYTVIFSKTIGPIVQGRRVVLATLLILLFCLVVVNLGATWHHVREVFIVHNGTRDSMFLAFVQQTIQAQVVDMTLVISVLVADSLMVWRCYMLWQESKVVISFFALLFLAEIAIFPLATIQFFEPTRFLPTSMLCVFLFISVGITICATSLIIYRIKHVTTDSRYSYIIEVLAQSGAMYSITLLITAAQLIARTNHPNDYALVQSTSYWGGIVTPITGISTTLVSSRITSRASRNSSTFTQPVSGMVFKDAAQSETYIANNDTQRSKDQESRGTEAGKQI
ncbi:hypothetical protein D9619_012706 [Psilocybe cf. subviscida]|uniref:Uncharacterized protein n=1 Tax=Psilocybe cf. subviscida TaxID=2480587 RepID=A0A8H5ER24_9AGAR|nr:hypothetical protein D9619_012706 [Psilocybe cf. subviscida]